LPSPVREISAAERIDTFPSGGNSGSGEVLLPPSSERNPICRAYRWMDVCCRAILLVPPSELSPSSGRVHGCMLWSNLVAASEWVVSIFGASAWLYVVEQSYCYLRVGCLHLRSEWMIIRCGGILLLSPSGLSPYSGRVDDCMLWSNLVAAFEWVVSIFGASG